MNFLNNIPFINILFISVYGVNLIRIYILSNHHFSVSGLSFFKLLMRLIILNLFLYLIHFNDLSASQKDTDRSDYRIFIVSNHFKNDVVTNAYLINIKSYLKLNKQLDESSISLNYIDRSQQKMAKIIPSTTPTLFLNYLSNPKFRMVIPQFMFELPGFRTFKDGMFIQHGNEELKKIMEFNLESNWLNYLFGNYWKSGSSLSIYLLFLLIILVSLDLLFTFQILKY